MRRHERPRTQIEARLRAGKFAAFLDAPDQRQIDAPELLTDNAALCRAKFQFP